VRVSVAVGEYDDHEDGHDHADDGMDDLDCC
jgi:hypothetical protein